MTGWIRSVAREKNMTETLADFPNSAEYVTSTDNRMKALGIYIYDTALTGLKNIKSDVRIQ